MLTLTTIRDPFAKLIKNIIPTFALSIVLLALFFIDINDVTSRVEVIRLELYSYFSLLKKMRDGMP